VHDLRPVAPADNVPAADLLAVARLKKPAAIPSARDYAGIRPQMLYRGAAVRAHRQPAGPGAHLRRVVGGAAAAVALG
jgi:hypothetical protein